jgi:GNAT superfamily N-acetyltransferase
VITWSYVSAIRYGGRDAGLEELIVDDKARGTGAGMALLKAAIAEARSVVAARHALFARNHARFL